MKLTLSILKGYFFKSKFLSLLFILTALSIGIIYSSLAVYLNFLETNVITKTLNSLGASNKNIWLLNTDVSLSENYLDAQSGLIEELVEEESGLIKNNSKILKLNLSKKSPFKNMVHKKNSYQYSSIHDYHFSVVSIDNLFENVSILTSTDENKEGVFNISISENTSKQLDVLVGDIIILTDPLYPEPLRFHVSKIFQLDENDEFWMGQTSVVNPQTNVDGFIEIPFSINSKDLLKLNKRSEGKTSLYWMYFLSDDLIFDFGPAKSIKDIRNIKNQLSLTFPGSLIIDPMVERLESNLTDFKKSLPSILIISSMLIMTSIIISLLPVLQLGEKFQLEFYTLKMRGLTGNQLFADIIIWLVLFVFPICLIGSLIGIFLVNFITGMNQNFTGGFLWGLTPNVLNGIFASLISIIAISIPIFIKRILQNYSINNSNTFTRAKTSSMFQIYYLDIIIICLAGVSFWESSISGFNYLSSYNGENIAQIAILKTVIPMFWFLGLIFLVLRIFYLINLITEKSKITLNRPLWLRFSLINITRRPNEYAWILLIFWIATCTILTSRTIINTVDSHVNDSLSYQIGGDIRVNDVPLEYPLDESKIDDPDLGFYSQSVNFRGLGSLGKEKFKFLGIQPDFIEPSIWYRDDFSSKPISELMPKIQITNSEEKLFIKRNIKSIGLTINDSTAPPSYVQLWLRVKFNNGKYETIPISNCKIFNCYKKDHPLKDWSTYYINLVDEIKESIEIIGILAYETAPEDLSTEFTVKIKEINFSTNKNLNNNSGRFNYLGVIPLNSSTSWKPLPTSEGVDSILNFYNLEREPDSEYMNISFGSGSDEGIRGVYISSFDEFPVIASKSFLDSNNYKIGENLTVHLAGHYVNLRIADSVDLFPTLDPSNNGFIILNGKYLIDFLKIRGPLRFNSTEIIASSQEIESEKSDFSRINKSVIPGSKLNSYDLDFSPQGKNPMYLLKKDFIKEFNNKKVTRGALQGLNILSIFMIPVLLALGSISFVFTQAISRSSEWISSKRIGINLKAILTHVIIEYLIVILVGILFGIITSSIITNILVNELIEVFYKNSTLEYLPIFLKVNWLFYSFLIISAIILLLISTVIGINNTSKRIYTQE